MQLRINYESLQKLRETLNRVSDKVQRKQIIGNPSENIKEIALKKAQENVSGRMLDSGKMIHIRSGKLLAGIRVEDDPEMGFKIVSTAMHNGVNYGYVLEHGATIYPKKAKCLVFRVPQGAIPHTGFAGYSEALVFAKKVTIPAFGWIEEATRDTIAETFNETQEALAELQKEMES